jgi:hypothetical protein
MKDASRALNSGLVFSSSSRKCQVFKMIYCHAVRWGDGGTWKWTEGRLCARLHRAPGFWSQPTVDCGQGIWLLQASVPLVLMKTLAGSDEFAPLGESWLSVSHSKG